MEHQEIREKLAAFRDPETGEEERREMTAHLETCEECRGIFSRWERISSALARTPMPAPSEAFVDRVMDRIHAFEQPEEAAAVRPAWGLPRWMMMALGYGLGIFLMVLAIEQRQLTVNSDSVLLSDVPQNAQWSFAAQPPESGQVFGAAKEDL